MVSTDGSRDDEAREEGSPDESVLPPGPRRSTYTPPVNPSSAVPGSGASAESTPAEPPRDAAPPAPPRPRDDLPAFVPPPPPADFEFPKPETGPVNVVYQLDDIEPNLPFDVAIETLAQSPVGARILPKEAAEPAPVADADSRTAAPVANEPTPIVIEPVATAPTAAVFDLDASSSSEMAANQTADSGPASVVAEPDVSASGEFVAGQRLAESPESGNSGESPADEARPVDDAAEAMESADAAATEAPPAQEEEESVGEPLAVSSDEATAYAEPESIPLPDFYEPATVQRSEPRPADAEAEMEYADGIAIGDVTSSDGEQDWSSEPETERLAVDEPANDRFESAGQPSEPVFVDPRFDTPAFDEMASDEPASDEPSREPQFSDLRFSDELSTPAPLDDPALWRPESAAAEPAYSEPVVSERADSVAAGSVPADDVPADDVTAEDAPVDETSFDDRTDEVQAHDEPLGDTPANVEAAPDEPVFREPVFEQPTYSEPSRDDWFEKPVDVGIDHAEPVADEIQHEAQPAVERDDVPASGADQSDDARTQQDDSGGATVSDAPLESAPTPEQPPLTEAEQLAALSQQGAPAGRPWVPERRSLKDAELSSLLTGAIDLPNGTLGVMEELERQLQLREEETREFQEWQDSMLAVGTPEAIAAVEKVLPEFTDIVPPGTAVAIAAAASAAPPPVQPPVTTPPAGFPPPPPMGAPRSTIPPPVVQAPSEENADAAPSPGGEPAYDDVSSHAEREATIAAPPPLVEPPAPTPPDSWDFDLDADTIIPELADAAVASHEDIDTDEVVVETGDVIDQDEQILPAPIASKYAPTTPTDSSIFIDPIPVAPDDDSNAPSLVEPGAFGGPFVDPVYSGPLTGSISIGTGGLSLPPDGLDSDIDDPLDEIDQAGFDAVFGASPATAPVLVTRVADDEVVLGEPELNRPRIFSLEAAGAAPTPEDQRVGRAARMFWMWFAANASIASIAFGGIVFSLGLSLRQAIVAVLAGVAVSFLPLGLGTLAGKRSGQPTMVVSRAAFGLSGNALPAAVAVISRVFWGSALLWILGQGVASVLEGAGLTGPLGRDAIAYLVMGVGLAVAIVFAIFGYGLIVLLQLISSIASSILIVGLIVLTWQYVDIGVALTHSDGPWTLAGTAAVLVFSFIGLLWANSSGDLARYQRPGSSSPGSMLSAGFGATIPTFVLISYGALLAASDPAIAAGLVADPFDTIGSLLPLWYPAPLIAAIVLGLLSAVVVSIYSGGFALTAVGVRLTRLLSVVVIGALIAAGAVALVLAGTDYTMLFRDFATTLAVPVAAWAGIFAADAMIRQRGYDAEALLVRGGVYPTVNWVNLSAFVAIVAIGFGLTTASVGGLGWQGYLFPLLGLPLDGAVAGTDLGVMVALVLGLLTPIVAGIPAIRKQEASPRRTG